jgi:hypothetical protein
VHTPGSKRLFVLHGRYPEKIYSLLHHITFSWEWLNSFIQVRNHAYVTHVITQYRLSGGVFIWMVRMQVPQPATHSTAAWYARFIARFAVVVLPSEPQERVRTPQTLGLEIYREQIHQEVRYVTSSLIKFGYSCESTSQSAFMDSGSPSCRQLSYVGLFEYNIMIFDDLPCIGDCGTSG